MTFSRNDNGVARRLLGPTIKSITNMNNHISYAQRGKILVSQSAIGALFSTANTQRDK